MEPSQPLPTPNATAVGSNTNAYRSKSTDPARKYSTQQPGSRNNFLCHFCGKLCTGGVYRMKWHFIGGLSDVKGCPNCPEHVKEEVRSFIDKKEMESLEKKMSARRFDCSSGNDVDEGDDCVEVQGETKKPRQKGPLDRYFTPNPEDVVKAKGGKGGKQQTINVVVRKELRDKACQYIARWFYDAGIPFHAANYNSFDVMIEAIGQFGPGMKPPSMYELRVPLLKQEVKEVEEKVTEHKKEWADKGCSILSDGWRDSVVSKDIINFMVNSPKGSIFVKSMDVSNVSKDANLLFGILDKMVDEVGEKNVVQVITDNASAYVKAGNILLYYIIYIYI